MLFRNCSLTQRKLPHMSLSLNQNAKASMWELLQYICGTRPQARPDRSHLLQQRYRIKDTHLNEKTHWKRNLISIICRFLKSSNPSIKSWTGFNIIKRISNNLVVTKDTVGCLPTIYTPATSMNTVNCELFMPLVSQNLLSSMHVNKLCLRFKQYKNYLRT